MFEQLDEREEEQSTEEQEPDWTGVKIASCLIPVFLLFIYFGKAEMGFTIDIVLGMILLAIKLQWKLRKHVWFWATIAIVLLCYVPLLLFMRWPDTKAPTIAYSMPFGIADFLIISGAIKLAENLFLKDSPSDEEQ
jgi:uncharacterized membrane protein YwaF